MPAPPQAEIIDGIKTFIPLGTNLSSFMLDVKSTTDKLYQRTTLMSWNFSVRISSSHGISAFMTLSQPLQNSFKSAISDLVTPLLSSRTSLYIELPAQLLS